MDVCGLLIIVTDLGLLLTIDGLVLPDTNVVTTFVGGFFLGDG
jgi:hypothetical protein